MAAELAESVVMGKAAKRATEPQTPPQAAKKQKTAPEQRRPALAPPGAPTAPSNSNEVQPTVSVDPFISSFCSKFVNPEDSIQFIAANADIPVDEFLLKHWEKAPLAMLAEEEEKEYFKIFGYEYFCKLLTEVGGDPINKFISEKDFVFAKFVGKKKELKELSEDLTLDNFKMIFDEEECFIHFHQPQRFQDGLWALMEKMESYFGCLVDAKALMSPAEGELLAPFYDDVESFILQLEGRTTWTLYKPLVELSNEYAEDLNQDKIGSPILHVTLKPGDILYIPRGTIQEAKSETRASLVLFSTYQNQNMATLLDQTISQVLNSQVKKSMDMRRGLPLGFLPSATSLSNVEYANALVKFAESLKKETLPLPVPENMVTDFMSNRLPPFGMAKFNLEASRPPRASDKVRFRNKYHVAYFVRKCSDNRMDEVMAEDNDEEELAEINLEDKEVLFVSSLSNSRASHMMIQSHILDTDGEAFAIADSYKSVMDILMNSDEPVTIKTLQDEATLFGRLDVMILIRGLFNLGALEICE